uniref:Uncharacterized protein n=1 Tax=Thermus caliditerrae TaxID=1330700 RepID=A0A7C5VG30_9DEIN
MREAVLEFRRDLATRSFVTWSEIRREAALLGFYSLEAVREGEVTLEIRSWKRGELLAVVDLFHDPLFLAEEEVWLKAGEEDQEEGGLV